jgi:diadenosine tetraphosphatase ApaH/serine/threonine PP2A family protein phosphatase
MRAALLSDVHGNRHAFEAVLEDVAQAGVDAVWCLGDLVGYGAEPNACVALARERCAVVLAGNHDLAVTGDISLEEFSRGAALAAHWTQSVIEEEHLAFLRGLSPQGQAEGIGLYHGSPRDPVWEYVLSSMLADLCLTAQPERLSFVGHSHVALSFSRDEGAAEASGTPREPGEVADLTTGEWIMNPGSVGQPRDGDPRAAWLELDTTAWTAAWRRVPYDIEGAQAAIRAAGLPGSLADRLGYGQ